MHHVLSSILAFHFITTKLTSRPTYALKNTVVGETAMVIKELKASSQLWECDKGPAWLLFTGSVMQSWGLSPRPGWQTKGTFSLFSSAIDTHVRSLWMVLYIGCPSSFQRTLSSATAAPLWPVLTKHKNIPSPHWSGSGLHCPFKSSSIAISLWHLEQARTLLLVGTH